MAWLLEAVMGSELQLQGTRGDLPARLCFLSAGMAGVTLPVPSAHPWALHFIHRAFRRNRNETPQK